MSCATELRAELSATLGSEIRDVSPISGGSICQASRVVLADGRRIFLKTLVGADPVMFAVEARGLAWLAEAEALAVPEVLAVGEAFLALELIESGPRVRDFDDRLGRGLAALHGFGAGGFGLDYDNIIGRLPQSNRAADSWADFYARERLRPQIERAASHWSKSDRRDFDHLLGILPQLVGDPEPPARLHGDLWGGNLHVTAAGQPCLIDPAAYGGHREVDLAMMQLFGGFSPRVFAAYDEAMPLEPEWRDRIPLYQLYYLLVHVNLFGGGYVGQTLSALRHYL